MSCKSYHSCPVPECKNSTVKTPEKLWIVLPTSAKMRNTWLKLAKRDPKSLSLKSNVYFCEDHFDLENDMENYIYYKIMGSVRRVRMKPNCIPSRFDCQADRKHKSTPSEPRLAFIKRQRMFAIKEIEENMENDTKSKPSCSQDISALNCDKADQVVQAQEHKVTQVSRMTHYINKYAKQKDIITSQIETTVHTARSPLKKTKEMMSKSITSTLQSRYESDKSYTPSITCSTVKITSGSKTTSDASSEEELYKFEKINLKSTLSKVKNKPLSYIGLPKELYFLINLIEEETNVSEQNILLCLMRIKLHKTFSQLADDFDISVTQARSIFFNKMPKIVKALSPFIKKFSNKTIKTNLPSSPVTCIIDCFEVEIQEPKKTMYQALTWSDYKKTNSIKYLVACSPDGLVRFVSSGYAGRITDVKLVEHSKFLDSLPPNACILADRGFKHLEQFLFQKGFTLLRPPSFSTGSKPTKAEAQQTKQIDSLRIHVERVIRRLREFAMLKMRSVINLNQISMLDFSMTTACALINLQDGLIK